MQGLLIERCRPTTQRGTQFVMRLGVAYGGMIVRIICGMVIASSIKRGPARPLLDTAS
jgi:hypothetical protein